MCLDTGYYLASVTAYEWDKDYNFVWRLVGRHIRWNKRITDMAYRYLERLWGLKAGDVFPEVRACSSDPLRISAFFGLEV